MTRGAAIRRLRRAAANTVAIGALVCACPPSLAQQDAGDRRAVLREQRQRLEAFYEGQPLLDAARVDQVFRLRTEGGRIVWQAPLIDRVTKLPGEQYRARLREFDNGLTSVYLARSRTDDGTGRVTELRSFSLTYYDFSTPGVVATVSVQGQQDYFHVDCSAQLPDGYRSVRISEQAPRLEWSPQVPSAAAATRPSAARDVVSAGEGTAQLSITIADRTGGPQMLTFVEPDFQSLVRRHPKEVEEHVRPLFRRLGQDQVFAPDPLVAWQVFADRWVGDESVRRRVEALLPALCDGDFRARDRALAQLEDLGRPAAAVLLRMNRARLTPEQYLRIDRALLPYLQLPADEAVRLRSDVGFLLDCLYVEDADLRRVTLERLREVTGQAVPFDDAADLDRRATSVAALRRQLQLGSGGR